MARPRLALNAQVGIVGLLFLASLGTLVVTFFSVMGRNEHRNTAGRNLSNAGAAMASRASIPLASMRPWPGMSLQEWESLDQKLGKAADDALASFGGVEGGYYVQENRRFLGAAFPTRSRTGLAGRQGTHRSSGPPPLEYDLVETQVDASIRKRKPIFIIQAVSPSTVAVRTAPIEVDGRVVGATWTMTRLVDPVVLDRSIRGYSWAAALALGGIALALVLTAGLANSLRREVAQRHKLEFELRRSERLAALGKLLAGVAHEVRNPLAGIRAITQLWKRGIGIGDEAFDHLTNEVDRLEQIVSRLLQFSKADAQKLAPGDLNALVAEAARLTEDLARTQKVSIELRLQPGLPKVEMAAPALLQVLRNLTTNALQFMPNEGVLRLETKFNRTQGKVAATVADTGPGISQEAHEHLFEPFFTTKAEGTGLGLAIAREIALAHRGDLEASNLPDRGAAFTLTLPAARSESNGDLHL